MQIIPLFLCLSNSVSLKKTKTEVEKKRVIHHFFFFFNNILY